MEFKNFAYLLLLLLFIVIPAILGIQKQVHFSNKLKYLFPSILFTGAIFAIWNIRFTQLGIWSFNPSFLVGLNILNLPLEIWLSFLLIPFSSVFVYEFLKIKLNHFEKANIFLAVSLVIFVTVAMLSYFSRQKLFTFFTFFLLTIYLGYTIFRNRFRKHYTKFYITYIISLFPFLIFMGVLSSVNAIYYNPDHILGNYAFGITIENFAYLFLLLLMNITIYEYLKERQFF